MSKRQGGTAKPLKQAKKQPEDKTFGMKNKKGKAAQKVVQTYSSAGKNKEDKIREQEKEAKKMARAEKERLEQERNLLFKSVERKPKQLPQVVPPGVDPKSVLCINFKAGHCANGDKCIFSHDLSTERKGEKRDAYSDQRELENDTIDTWDDKKLAEVVAKKTAATTAGLPNAGICKHFIKALEDRKFGWFWECPNGAKCQYRHALPPGFKLAEKKPKEEKGVERSIEDILEEKRAALPSTGGTPVTADSFVKWKAKINKAKEAEDKKNKQARSQAIQSGKLRKTGREILQESDFKEELEEGEDLDILALLHQKNREEEAMDKENAELVQKLTAEAVESERAFDKKVAELEAQGLSAAEAIAKLSLSEAPIIMPSEEDLLSPRIIHNKEYHKDNENDQNDENDQNSEMEGDEGEVEDGENVLEGVDTDLFEVEAEQGDLPEFSDEE